MKKVLAPFAIVMLLLTGCGEDTAGSSGEQATSKPAQSTSQDSAPLMPEVVGLKAAKAVAALRNAGIEADFVGPDGEKFPMAYQADTTVKESSVPADTPVMAAQRVTITLAASEAELSAQAETAKLAARYEYTCTTGTSTYTDKSAFKAKDFREVWASPAYGTLKKCDVAVAGVSAFDEFPLIGSEQPIVDTVAANQGDVSVPSGALLDVFEACTLPPSIEFDASRGPNNNRVEAISIAALDLCSDAPFAAELTRIATGLPPARMKDGSYIVGTSIQSGTYQVQVPEGANGVHDCYWERTTAQGGTIANDFVSYAPQGPAVTILDGEGFVSERCGTWSRIG